MTQRQHLNLKIEQAVEYNLLKQGSTPEFRSQNQDPNWVWTQLSLPEGWYKVIAKARICADYMTPQKCYYARNRAFNEQQSAYFEQRDESLHVAYLFISGECDSFRYDPMETTGTVAFESIEILACEVEDVPENLLLTPPSASSLTLVDRVKTLKIFPYLNRTLHKFPRLRAAIIQCLRATQSDTNGEQYQTWLAAHEHIPSLEYQKKQIAKLTTRPLISIVMPTFNTDPQLLSECIDSVIQQGYENWELCIADDASTESATKETLRRYAMHEPRIKLTIRESNGHICRASNSALDLASGDWVALLDHDDLLAPHALLCVAKAINANQDADIFYSDEDKISIDGVRSDPHLKPQWSKELLHSHNYVSHLGVYRKSIVNKVGNFRVGYEGSQDYDLLLRCVNHIESAMTYGDLKSKIIHIPHVLYHWRVMQGSTALNEDQKGYAQEAGIKALQDALPDTEVEFGLLANTYKVNWPIPAQPPLVSLIIPTKNGMGLVKQCIESVEQKTRYAQWEILLIDNQSDDPEALAYFKQLDTDRRVTLLQYNKPFNYSAINNYAVEQAKGSVVVLLNNDVEVINPDWLTELVSLCSRDAVGCVGAKLYYPNDTIQHAGVVLGLGGVAGHSHKHFDKQHDGYFKRLKIRQNLSAVTAACLAVRKDVYRQVGGLNESDLKVAFNDVDFCLKVHTAGYKNIWTPYAELYHHESISRGVEDTPEKQARFAAEIDYMKKRWGNLLSKDPYYHPLLTRDREDFTKR